MSSIGLYIQHELNEKNINKFLLYSDVSKFSFRKLKSTFLNVQLIFEVKINYDFKDYYCLGSSISQ